MEPPAKKPHVEDKDLPELEPRTYTVLRVLGKGTFGIVYQAQVLETGEIVAIKSVMQPQQDREISILKELDGHPNIVSLKGAFVSTEGGGEVRQHLVLEYLSDTLHRVIKHHNVIGTTMDIYYVKLYSYQLLRSLAFIHNRGIVHADVKPQNLLLDGRHHVLKLCDFGTARRTVFGEPLRPYVCSRYYRAPELILGSSTYNSTIDLWSAGCVMAELILGQPLFTGKDGINQLLEVIKVLGTPTGQDLRAMNPNYPEYEFTPKVVAVPWDQVYRGRATREACDLTDVLLKYAPLSRIPPLEGLMHNFFDGLRLEEKPGHRVLFNFRDDELWWAMPQERDLLVPKWMSKAAFAQRP